MPPEDGGAPGTRAPVRTRVGRSIAATAEY